MPDLGVSFVMRPPARICNPCKRCRDAAMLRLYDFWDSRASVDGL
jgi:hypothetical protein